MTLSVVLVTAFENVKVIDLKLRRSWILEISPVIAFMSLYLELLADQ